MGRTDLRPDITKEVLEEYIRKGYSQNRIAINSWYYPVDHI